jgi:CBS domain-containing protein
VLLGLFLRLSARTSLQDLEARRWLQGHPLGEVMLAEQLETLPAQMTIGQFIEQGHFTAQHGMYPISTGGHLVGVVEPADILAAPKHLWDRVTLGEVCAPLDTAPTAPASEDAHVALDRMRRTNRSRLLVLDQGRLVGIVTLADLLERLQLAQLLERVRGAAPARAA